ncbi:FAD-NAD(P)-binding-domain-containing protein [Ilyonectria destructans]|nr:FAD-NAD(P)-binding-domain-containing protein [Ilyonectria destructans]
MSGISPRFAIVGGGLSGVACLNGLVKQIIASDIKCVSITIFEPSEKIGPGLPYRTDQPYCWLLNHEADHLGTLNGGDDGFLNWIAANRKSLSQEYFQAMQRGWVPTDPGDLLIAVDAKAYYPRTLFGRFLHFCFHEIKKEAEAKGIQVEVVAQAVQAMDEQDDGQLALRDAEGRTHLFDQAVLTSGHTYGPPNPNFAAQNTYISNVYVDEQRNSLITRSGAGEDSDAPRNLGTVAVKGTGLSANDAVMWLREQRELGSLTFDQIIMVSRRGQLRKTRVKTAAYRLQYLTQDILETRVRATGSITFDWLLPLVRNEMEAAYGGKPLNWKDIWNPRTADIQKQLAQSIKETASEQAIPWRSVILALAEVRQYIFEHLGDEEKRRYFRELCTLYHSYQAPMPAISAERLWKSMDSGLVKVEAGVSDISLNETTGKYCLTFLTGEDGRPVLVHEFEEGSLPTGAREHQLEVDYLIEAIGQTRDVKHFQAPYSHLLDAKFLRAHRWGGLHVDPESRQPIKADGRRWENVWQLGINSQGDVLISNNAPNNIADGLRIGLWMVNRWEEQQKSQRVPAKAMPASTVWKASSLMEINPKQVIRAVVHVLSQKSWIS